MKVFTGIWASPTTITASIRVPASTRPGFEFGRSAADGTVALDEHLKFDVDAGVLQRRDGYIGRC